MAIDKFKQISPSFASLDKSMHISDDAPLPFVLVIIDRAAILAMLQTKSPIVY